MSDRLTLLERLLDRLRGPDGCPWDREQGLEDLRAYLLEEAHEVAAAIDADDPVAIGEELGDLLFQVVFVSRLAEEKGGPALGEVIETVHTKLVDRHPHVFGDQHLEDAAAVRVSWEKRKARQRDGSILQGVPATLPALTTAYRMTQKAAGVGFDWEAPEDIFDKIEEELGELRDALAKSVATDRSAVREEVGDLLFTVANLARRLGFDPEAALAVTNQKFRHRFGHVERRLADGGRRVEETELDELEALWQEAKTR